jgi:hypothetical protein
MDIRTVYNAVTDAEVAVKAVIRHNAGTDRQLEIMVAIDSLLVEASALAHDALPPLIVKGD